MPINLVRHHQARHGERRARGCAGGRGYEAGSECNRKPEYWPSLRLLAIAVVEFGVFFQFLDPTGHEVADDVKDLSNARRGVATGDKERWGVQRRGNTTHQNVRTPWHSLPLDDALMPPGT